MPTKIYDVSGAYKNFITDYPYLGKIATNYKEIPNGILNINSKNYIACRFDRTKKVMAVRKLNKNIDTQGVEHKYEHQIICPYCKTQNNNSWEAPDQDDDYECNECGGIMEMERIVTVEYSTIPKRPPNIIKTEFMD